MARFGRTLVVLCLLSCSRTPAQKPIITLDAPAEKSTTVLLVGVKDQAALRKQADTLGLTVSGDAVLEISGPVRALNALRVSSAEDFSALEDERIGAELNDHAEVDPGVFYLARRDFGLPTYLTSHPTHDGRGVTVGIIDDGISPNNDGFRTTTTGERKFLKRSGNSTLLRLTMTSVARGSRAAFAATYTEPFDAVWQGEVDETASAIDWGSLDLNDDSAKTKLAVAVFLKDGVYTVCLDSRFNSTIDADECFGTFTETGEYGYWTADRLVTVMADFDPAAETLQLSQGEFPGDSHGEGVASVLAGHGIGGQFDGVAPGAKILDYDLSEASTSIEESRYTLATFTRALDWLGTNGAEVVNISYSLFFSSAASQKFMRDALAALVERHNFVISFSAGNNGPGLSSFNRGLVYPKTVLTAGAFVSRDLDAHVHGVTGLPEPGRVVWYSSRGPSPDGGTSPTAISPLASLTHSDPSDGFGAFSGTSSASPALAGLAAVLISAVKQEGLTVDASAIVHAIRLSGVPLTDTPYIFQGSGLPKITEAVTAYRRLVSGDDFAYVVSETGAAGPDGVTTSGLFLKSSATPNVYATSISLQGKLATSVPAARRATILKPIRIEYSHPWLVGSDRLFLAASPSNLNLEVRVAEALAALGTARGGELFGEVRILDDATGQVLHVVPVTLIDDAPLTSAQTVSMSIASEDGARHHVNVPAGVVAMRVRTRVLQGDASSASLRIYNPSSTLAVTGGGENEWLVPVRHAGWWQVTVGRWGGTPAPLELEVTAEPVQLALGTTVVSTSTPKIKINNVGARQDVLVTLTPSPKLVQESFAEARYNAPAVIETTLPGAGSYFIEASPATTADVRYWRPDCKISKVDASDEPVQVKSDAGEADPLTYVDGEDLRLRVSCLAFEANQLHSLDSMVWQIRILASNGTSAVAQGIARLNPAATEAVVTPTTTLKADDSYDVSVSPLFNAKSRVKLGTVRGF